MSSHEEDSLWRGKLIATVESLNHNDDILWKKTEKIESKILNNCIGYENRISTLEAEIKSVRNMNKWIMRILVGVLLAFVGCFATMLVSLNV